MTRAVDPCGELRVAFYGRVACDADAAASPALARQYEECRRLLPPGAITAVFYDIGSHPAVRHHLGPLLIGGRSRPRDGGLNDLLAEATTPARRFDQLITSGPEVLTRKAEYGARLIDELDRAGVAYLLPVGGALHRPTELELAIMRLVTAECTEMRRRVTGGGNRQ